MSKVLLSRSIYISAVEKSPGATDPFFLKFYLSILLMNQFSTSNVFSRPSRSIFQFNNKLFPKFSAVTPVNIGCETLLLGLQISYFIRSRATTDWFLKLIQRDTDLSFVCLKIIIDVRNSAAPRGKMREINLYAI